MDLLAQLTAALGDRYRVERELGHGGMAVVFLAQDLKHRRQVAIKLLKPELSAVLGGERFLREIEIAAALQHPHVLPLYDSGQAGALLYYVMPFAEGESLRQRIAREQQLPLDAALQITREVGSALHYAHEHGIIHRDIKPENIMLSGGQAVVADFGIARALHAAGAEQQLTASGLVVGTPQYMSPEQAGGGTVDGRTDQYSLACTLYEMLIGQPPFTGPSSQAVIARHSCDPVPSLRVVRQTVPPAVEGAIMRAMAKVPADRFASIPRFLEALGAPEPGSVATVMSPPSPGRVKRRVRRRWMIALGTAVLAAAGLWRLVAGAITAVVVLPFEDLASGPDSSYLAEGMTVGLITDLAQIGSLKVISRSSGVLAQGRARSLADLASQLGVGAVVRGSLRKTGDSVRVNVRVIQAPDSALLLAKEYLGRLGDLPDLQREITIAVSGALRARLQDTERRRLDTRREVDQRAYDAYLRGRFHLERGEADQALKLFEQAGRIAPDWAPPYVGLANYYSSLPFSSDLSPAEVLPKARASLARAIELDETLAEAHAANGYIRAYYEWDWRSAEREFRRAVELRPNYSDAYFSYSRFLASRRRFDEAIAQLGRAVELDPLSLELHANRALLDYFAGRYDEAERRLGEVLTTDSTDVLAKWGRGLVAEQQGRLDDAIAILEPIVGSSLNRKSSLGHVYGVAGKTAQARRILTDLRAAAAKRYVPAYWFALVHAGLGERDQALRHLERAFEERSTIVAYLLIDPRLAPLRGEPRFVALSRRLQGE
jgi:TolB-like protein/Flp pilus assembly protein TadD